MSAIIKTFTYLIIDISTHSVVIYFAVHLFGYKISITQTGVVAITIEGCEMVMYFIHEKIWERILKKKGEFDGREN